MPRKDSKNDKQQQAKPARKTRVNTKAAHNRHQRSIQKAAESRRQKILGKGAAHFKANEQQDKIDKKAATRRRLATLTPAQRADHREAGRTHTRPRDMH